MTKKEIFAKLQTEVTIRGLSPGTYYPFTWAVNTDGQEYFPSFLTNRCLDKLESVK